jgi:hypothetical protein
VENGIDDQLSGGLFRIQLRLKKASESGVLLRFPQRIFLTHFFSGRYSSETIQLARRISQGVLALQGIEILQLGRRNETQR